MYGGTKGRVRDVLVVEWLESNCDWVVEAGFGLVGGMILGSGVLYVEVWC